MASVEFNKYPCQDDGKCPSLRIPVCSKNSACRQCQHIRSLRLAGYPYGRKFADLEYPLNYIITHELQRLLKIVHIGFI